MSTINKEIAEEVAAADGCYKGDPQAYAVFEYENTDTKKNGNGFFINLGLEYSILPRFSIFGEIEVSSAGVGGRSGFEGSSIGGFHFSTGAYVRLF